MCCHSLTVSCKAVRKGGAGYEREGYRKRICQGTETGISKGECGTLCRGCHEGAVGISLQLPLEGQMLLPEVETLEFIKEGRSIVMYGNPGTGKTHIAIALGIKACLEGYSVFFTSVPRLLTHIREARTEKTLRNLEIKFERYDLVICDELGYVGFDKESAEMLFNHLSLRTGKKSTIITTNLPFTRWEEVLKDKVLCSALVDRLCHKSYLVNMTGTSYRIKETKK